MFNDVIEWFKGLFGDTAGEVVNGATDTLDHLGPGVEDTLGSAQEMGPGVEGNAGQFLQDSGVTDLAQDFQENALGEVTEPAQGLQEQAQALGGIAEDPWGAAAEGVRGQFTDEN